MDPVLIIAWMHLVVLALIVCIGIHFIRLARKKQLRGWHLSGYCLLLMPGLFGFLILSPFDFVPNARLNQIGFTHNGMSYRVFQTPGFDGFYDTWLAVMRNSDGRIATITVSPDDSRMWRPTVRHENNHIVFTRAFQDSAHWVDIDLQKKIIRPGFWEEATFAELEDTLNASPFSTASIVGTFPPRSWEANFAIALRKLRWGDDARPHH